MISAEECSVFEPEMVVTPRRVTVSFGGHPVLTFEADAAPGVAVLGFAFQESELPGMYAYSIEWQLSEGRFSVNGGEEGGTVRHLPNIGFYTGELVLTGLKPGPGLGWGLNIISSNVLELRMNRSDECFHDLFVEACRWVAEQNAPAG